MKAIRKSDGQVIEVKEWRGSSDVIYSTLDMNEFYQASDLDFNLPEEKVSEVIEGWMARTQNGKLGICRVKPERRCGDWWLDISPVDHAMYVLPSDLFPSLTWESEPLRVKLQITPME